VSYATIELVIKELGIKYSLSGDEAVACCPSHSDRHPSWSVNLRSGIHYCFTCGFSGNLAYLVCFIRKISYAEAVIWVNQTVGAARNTRWREDYQNKNYGPAQYRLSETDLAMFTDPPQDALESKFLDLSSAQLFDVRWNPGESAWIFPIRDPFSRELWGYQVKNDRYFRSYPAGTRKSRTLFGISAFEHGSTAVLVESPVDAVRLASAGIRGGLSGFGVQISDYQFSLVQRVAEYTILALDNDSAGIQATARICSDTDRLPGLRVFSYGDSVVKDPGEMTDEEIRSGIENSTGRLRWLRDHADGKITRVPGRTGRAVPEKENPSRSILDGSWKNGHRNSRSRKAD
jgi:CHC2 zinc finger/Toprim-like